MSSSLFVRACSLPRWKVYAFFIAACCKTRIMKASSGTHGRGEEDMAYNLIVRKGD
ncbi:MAG: hypothetical protein NTU95_07645 [Methanothrix sp.]|nr:hypothetical protein [Methanothrix sp.]